MNKFYSVGIIFYLVVLSPAHLTAQTLISNESSVLSDSSYQVSVNQWMTKGDFRMHGGPPNANNTWELTHPLDGGSTQIMLAYAEKKDSPYVINVSLSSGNIRQGSIRDTDWDSSGVVSDLSYSTSQGGTFGFSFSTDYRITDAAEPYEFYLTCGYNYLNISVDYRNALTTVSNYIPTSISTPVKWQIYDLLSQGLEFGVKGKSEVLPDLFVTGSLGYAPFTMAEYKGTRYPDDIPVPAQNEHIVAYGATLSYELKASYKLSRKLFIDAGYRYQAGRTDGEDQSDSAWSGSWEKLDTDFKGFFFGGSLQF